MIAVSLGGAANAGAAVPFRDISTAGPIQHIYLGNELSCQVKLTEDQLLSFYPADTVGGVASIPGDCGTFVAAGGTLYSPGFAAHDRTATGLGSGVGGFGLNGGLPVTPFTPVSQTVVAGAGTSDDPFVVTTVAGAGGGLQVSQRDSYELGESFYTTEITIANSSPSAIPATLYHGGDCYLANDDFGYGMVVTQSGGVYCTENPNNTPRGRMIGFAPFGAAQYVETQWPTDPSPQFPEFWSLIEENGSPLPNTCRCGVKLDNAAALSWSFSVPNGGSVTRRFITTISASGIDLNPPETEITGGPAQDETLSTRTPTFSFAADEPGSTFTCRVDAAEFDPCISPFTTPALANGDHHFEVTAVDVDGNDDLTPATRDFRVDSDDPEPDPDPDPDPDPGPGGPPPTQGPAGAADQRACAGKPVTLAAGDGSGTLKGTPAGDVILGGPKNDALSAVAGDDRVCGGEGDDRLKGGGGDDVLRGGPGDDILKGGGGDDVCKGGGGTDIEKSCE